MLQPKVLYSLWLAVTVAYCYFIYWHRRLWLEEVATEEEKKRGWIFRFRWDRSLILMLLGVLGMVILMVEFHDRYMSIREKDTDRFSWGLVVPLIGAPVGLFLWFIRDKIKEIERDQKSKDQEQKALDQEQKVLDQKQKEKDQDQRELERLQVDFHKYIEWTALSGNPALRTVALINLKSFITGEVFGSPRANEFQIPGLSLLITLLNLGMEIKDPDRIDRANFLQVERVFKHVLSVKFQEALIVVRNGSSWRSLAEEGKAFLNKTFMEGADLQEADLRGGNLRAAYLERANLQRANLERANLEQANLKRANLWRTNLEGANLQSAKIQESKLMSANLQEADLRWANLNGVDIKLAELENIKNWTELKSIEGADITGIRNPPEGFVKWALENGAIFDRSIFKRANLRGTNLEGIYLGRSDLQEVNLQRTNLERADLSWSNLKGAKLVDAWLKGANLEGIYLGRSDLQKAHLQQANLERAVLGESNLHEARLQGANLKHTKDWEEIKSIEGANITDVKNAPDGFVEWALDNGAIDENAEEK